jgi:hypothetical protein
MGITRAQEYQILGILMDTVHKYQTLVPKLQKIRTDLVGKDLSYSIKASAFQSSGFQNKIK